MDANKTTELVLYRSKDGAIQLDAQLERKTIWLDAHQMSELFGRDRTVILKHLRNVYTTGELDREATCAKIAQVAADGKTRQMDIFNLDLAVDRLYRSKPFTSDEERPESVGVCDREEHLEHLFKLYEEMASKEQLI